MEVSYTAPYVPAALLWAIGTALTWLLWVRPEKVAEPVLEPELQRVTEWVPEPAGITGELAPVQMTAEAAVDAA